MFFALAQASGSLSVAGLVTAAVNLGVVMLGPMRARVVDRLGRRVLPAFALAYAACGAGLLLCAYARAPLGVVMAAGAMMGACPPPLGAAMRTAWSEIAPQGAMRTRAYSLDAVVEEVIFTAGPLAASLAIALVDPLAAVGAGFTLMIVGAAAFGSGPATRARTSAGQAGRQPRARVLRIPRFWTLLLTLAGVFCALGLLDIAVPVTAAHAGSPEAAGYLLAALSASSAAGGLLFGRRRWARPWHVLLSYVPAILAVLIALMSLTSTLWLLAVGLALTGLVLAPSLIMGYLIADELAPDEGRTEASAWLNTASNAGATVGMAVGGLLAEGPTTALLFVAASLVLLATALGPGRALSRGQTTVLAATQYLPGNVGPHQ
ncbi:MFS transporter [Catellatospora methionotrophica]|uniref:MFS transporter n=2 Tax=Catellatospora methionotrophica TaxID=121620 RepID=A0A8J3PGZ8_9ACTN|nr:MFS transporter [Catellatospora methionotrophica]